MHILPGEVDFHGDIQAFAANIASILNGAEPIYTTEQYQRATFWKDTPHGFEIRTCKSRGEITIPALIVSFNNKASIDINPRSLAEKLCVSISSGFLTE